MLLERLRYNRIESDRTPFWIVLALRRGCNLTSRVDYANTLGVYTTEYTQCNSNYASIGGTTSMTSFVCRHTHKGGEASRRRWSNFIPPVPPVNFRFKSEISSSMIYTGNDNNAIILETILHGIVSNDWSDRTFHSYFTSNEEMRGKLYYWIIELYKKKHHGITNYTRRFLK